ncbi:MAG: tetratricopeptide repeat protein [Nitrospinae bacterium]|nr:tetratricopeptide repeat protein [Nitrospinota bacterium]
MIMITHNESRTKQSAVLFILLACLMSLIYLGTLNGEFLFDDFPRILENPGLTEPLSLKKIVTVGMPSRPFLMLTLAMNKYIGGDKTFGYHLFNTVVHVLNSILLSVVLTKFFALARFGEWKEINSLKNLPFIAALIFAVHPLQTESVSYAICRSEELSTFFYLLAVFFYVKAHRHKGTKNQSNQLVLNACAFFSAFLGVLSKEIAVTLPAVLVPVDYFFIAEYDLRRCAKRFFTALPFYIAIILTAVNLVKLDAGVGVYDRGVYENMLTQSNVVAFYIKLLFFPITQAFDYNFPGFRSLWTFPTPFSICLILGLLGLAVLLRKKNRLVSFSLLWFFITLSPTSSFVPVDDIIFEHRLYLPFVGVSILSGILLLRASNGLAGTLHVSGRKALFLISFFVFFLLSINALHRNGIYKDSMSFWEDAVRKAPWKDRPNNNLAALYGKAGRYKEVEGLLTRALEVSPWHPEARANLGEAYFHLGRPAEAEAEFNKVLKEHPDMPQANYFMGRMAEDGEDLKAAREYYEKTLGRKPELTAARNKLAGVFLKEGGMDQALFHFKKTLEKKPDDVEANANIGIVYGSMGFYDMAVRHLQAALKAEPGNPAVLKNLAYAQERLKEEKGGRGK